MMEGQRGGGEKNLMKKVVKCVKEFMLKMTTD